MLAPRLKSFLRSDRIGALAPPPDAPGRLRHRRLPAAIRRRLRIMNVTAYLIAAFTLVYALQQVVLDFQTWKPVILHQSGAGGRRPVGAVPAPLRRRCRPADPAALGEYRPVRAHLHPRPDSGLHLQYFAAIAGYLRRSWAWSG